MFTKVSLASSTYCAQEFVESKATHISQNDIAKVDLFTSMQVQWLDGKLKLGQPLAQSKKFLQQKLSTSQSYAGALYDQKSKLIAVRSIQGYSEFSTNVLASEIQLDANSNIRQITTFIIPSHIDISQSTYTDLFLNSFIKDSEKDIQVNWSIRPSKFKSTDPSAAPLRMAEYIFKYSGQKLTSIEIYTAVQNPSTGYSERKRIDILQISDNSSNQILSLNNYGFNIFNSLQELEAKSAQEKNKRFHTIPSDTDAPLLIFLNKELIRYTSVLNLETDNLKLIIEDFVNSLPKNQLKKLAAQKSLSLREFKKNLLSNEYIRKYLMHFYEADEYKSSNTLVSILKLINKHSIHLQPMYQKYSRNNEPLLHFLLPKQDNSNKSEFSYLEESTTPDYSEQYFVHKTIRYVGGNRSLHEFEVNLTSLAWGNPDYPIQEAVNMSFRFVLEYNLGLSRLVNWNSLDEEISDGNFAEFFPELYSKRMNSPTSYRLAGFDNKNYLKDYFLFHILESMILSKRPELSSNFIINSKALASTNVGTKANSTKLIQSSIVAETIYGVENNKTRIIFHIFNNNIPNLDHNKLTDKLAEIFPQLQELIKSKDQYSLQRFVELVQFRVGPYLYLPLPTHELNVADIYNLLSSKSIITDKQKLQTLGLYNLSKKLTDEFLARQLELSKNQLKLLKFNPVDFALIQYTANILKVFNNSKLNETDLEAIDTFLALLYSKEELSKLNLVDKLQHLKDHVLKAYPGIANKNQRNFSKQDFISLTNNSELLEQYLNSTKYSIYLQTKSVTELQPHLRVIENN